MEKIVPHFVGGKFLESQGSTFDKRSPINSQLLCKVSKMSAKELDAVIEKAKIGQIAWSEMPLVKRGEKLFALCEFILAHKDEFSELIYLETGKSKKDATGEVDAAVALGHFYAGEGQRFFGRTTTSGTPNRFPRVIREPLGIAGLIISANTPLANIAWKVFPALICGNAALLKSSEDAPLTADLFAKMVEKLVLPKGAFQLVHGMGAEIGAAIVRHTAVPVISFTGSSAVGREIAQVAGARLAKVSLELGGKNALVVCDDADLDLAVKWTLLSAFSNAGQRCASASRIIVFESIYDVFKDKLLNSISQLRVGSSDSDDYGPVINERQMNSILSMVQTAIANKNCRLLAGGIRLNKDDLKNGYYIAPTLLEVDDSDAEISRKELFGPVACLFSVRGLREAIALANDSEYGLTAAIHTQNIHRASVFSREVQCGVVVVNGGTYGSEPHMPFGGVKSSGNGTREPGPEGLDVYSNLKVIYEMIDPNKI